MNILYKYSIVLFCLWAFSCSSKFVSSTHPELNIIPRPVSTKTFAGSFILDHRTKMFISPADSELVLIADKLRKKAAAAGGFQLADAQTVISDNLIVLSLNSQLINLGDEGYQLTVLPNKIEIAASRPAGVFYGMQTLLQLLPPEFEKASSRKSWRIPCVEIVDYPRFSWRGQLLDVSRHFHPVDQIKRNLDHLARLKMNRFHWHLTDDQGWRIEIKSLPKLTEIGAWRVNRNDKSWWEREFPQPGEPATYGGFYTQEEIKEIIRYAQERYITIVPEIDMPGHSRAFMASYPEVSCDGGPYQVATGGDERNKDLCPGKEVTFELVEKVIDEVTALFPSPYYHIGGDECRKVAWQSCPDCRRRMQEEGLKDLHELQSYFIRRVEKMINARGKIMIGWDEILEGGLAPNAVVMSWRGETGGIESVRMGHDVIMTPFQYCYLDLKQGDPELEPDLGYSQLLLSTAYSYNPVPKDFTPEQAKRILGVQGNLWSESIQNEMDAEYMLFPRLMAIAEVGWTPQEARDWRDFVRRMEVMLKRFDALGINYARSAYNVWIKHASHAVGEPPAFTLETEAGTAEIHYTLDGSEPSRRSPRYTSPITLSKSTVIKARAFKEGKPFGKVTAKAVRVHKAAGKKIILNSRPSTSYDPGDAALTDCLRGRADQFNKYWLGFEGNDLDAVIDLGQNTAIRLVTLSFLESTFDGIFLPKTVQVSFSEDNSLYRDQVTIVPDQAAAFVRRVLEIEVPTKTPTRFIRVTAENLAEIPDWHPAAGNKAWLFIDEILVE